MALTKFQLANGDKFAVLAVENVHSELPKNWEGQLSDGTWVLTKVPVQRESYWREWIGSIRAERLKRAHLVLVRSTSSANPEILDEQHDALGEHLTQIFYMLALSGVLQYEAADVLKGSMIGGKTDIPQIAELPKFHRTGGDNSVPVTLARLEDAARLQSILATIYSGTGDYKRVGRGLNVLMDGLRQELGQERIHQFVRSLEALILPDPGKTQKQFVHRCQTFAKASPASEKILKDAFDMRSDTEHLHDWDRALQSYSEADRDTVALQRTRQMERLACFAYSRILGDNAICAHFKNETTQRTFWSHNDAGRKTIGGKQVDLTTANRSRRQEAAFAVRAKP